MSLGEDFKRELGSQQNPYDDGDMRVMRHLPRVGIYGETNQPMSEMYVTGSKAGQMQLCYHQESEGPNQAHGVPGFNVCLAETGFV